VKVPEILYFPFTKNVAMVFIGKASKSPGEEREIEVPGLCFVVHEAVQDATQLGGV
jgi:hypothetical protein